MTLYRVDDSPSKHGGDNILDREQAKEHIKAQLEDYLSSRGINTRKNFTCLNPLHADKKPSMSYDRKRKKAHCFSCGADYDTFDLIGIDHGLTDPADIFDTAHRLYNITLDGPAATRSTAQQDFKTPHTPNTQDAQEEKASQTEYINSKHQLVDKTDYFQRRGINQATIDRFNLGYDPEFKTRDKAGYATWKAVIIPTSPHSYTARNTDPNAAPEDRIRKRGPAQLFNPAALQSGKPVFIVEGEFDALSLVEVGAEATATASTAGVNQFINYVKHRPPTGGLILSLDNDTAGQEATEKLAQELTALKITFLQASITEGYKDPNEALVKDRYLFTQQVQAAQEALAAQLQAEKNAELDAYLKTSTAYYINDFTEGIKAGIDTPATPTGFEQLDQVLDGGLYEGLYIIGAITSLGKTTFIMQAADQIAQAGHDVLIFSLEMARSELMAKSISRLTFNECINPAHAKTARGITTGKRYEKYSPQEVELINKGVKLYAAYANRIYISEGIGDIGAAQIRETTARHINLTGRKPVVIIDYLQLLAPHEPRATDKQNTDKAVMELKRASRDFKIPVLAVSSFNRQNYASKVNMEAFKESGAIEYSSDVLIGLQAKGAGETGFNIDEAKQKDPRQVELKILKNRNGATGKSIYFEYYPLFNYFSEIDTEIY
jgi:replicative DNA helicase